MAVRIAAGAMRGRKLLPPPHMGTRPMTGMAKKSLFGILEPWLDGATVLDLYSGTGTLGLEAISRGASRAFFAERDRPVIERLLRNIAECRLEEVATVWAGNIESRLADWLEEMDSPADIAFVDPPFPAVRRWQWERIVRKIFIPLAAALAPDGVVVLRLPDDAPAPENIGPLTRNRLQEYGQMVIAFYGKSS
ncbi:MAG: 16S rRNA (guanine(966)-N(2))-methyltransferase RsmD [Phycisphaerae bacterium]|nr:16S rRNA (guanine(966)-N(2))-methyltransferase RsmD [Phycisphaerae bacterium]